MNNTLYIFARVVFVLMSALVFMSCDIEFEHETCDYNLEIVYWYDAEMTAADNKLSSVVFSLDEYIFDEDGILFAWRKVPMDECYGGYVSEGTLPPGRYSVITWGNRSDINNPNDAVVGVTRREDMLLFVDCMYSGSRGTRTGNLQDNGDRLYYTYRTFTVPETGVTRIKAGMVHSHLVLKYRIRWRGKAPENTKDFYTDLTPASSTYGFMPEFRYLGNTCNYHDPEKDDYRQISMENRHKITTVFDNRRNHHRIDVNMNGSKHIYGEFVTYRLRNTTPITMALWSAGMNNSGDPLQIMKDVDLQRWFYDKGIELDRNLKQDFYLDFEILEDGRVIVSEMEVGDWTEGGYLGF